MPCIDMSTQKILAALLAASVCMGVGGCHSVESWDNDMYGNFDALWTALDEHYCFFESKDVDWEETGRRYRAGIDPEWDYHQFFDHCSAMLAELKDGHTNLVSWFDVSYYRKWWSDYPQNYSARLVEEFYFNFNYRSVGGIDYGILPQNIGYMHYSSFSYGIGEGNLDSILAYCASCDGLIIDVRDNGGGSVSNVKTLVSRFITERLQAGTICHKNGPGHGDFSEPYPFYFDPAPSNRIMWGKPVVVLCNRSTFSAANNFVSVMKCLPGVTVAGSTTGGGSGMPFSSELTNGWGVRFSASPVRDPRGNLTEFGVEPTEGCEVNLDPNEALAGRDTMLDFAVARLLGNS